MEKEVVFIDIYGNSYCSLQSVCKKYGLNVKTLASRKSKAIKDGVKNITSVVDKYIIDFNEKYKQDWEAKASDERKKAVEDITVHPLFVDIFGKEFSNVRSICKEYNISENNLFKEKKVNLENGFNDITAIVDKCLIAENAEYKKSFLEKATQERKKAVIKISKDKDVIKSLNQNLVEQKNEHLRKRVEAVGKMFNKKIEEQELKDIEPTEVKPKTESKVEVKPNTEVNTKADDISVKIENAIKDIKAISDNTIKAVETVNKSTVEMIKLISDQTIEAIKELINPEKKTCVQKVSPITPKSTVESIVKNAKENAPKGNAQSVTSVTFPKRVVTENNGFTQTVNHKAEIFDSINVKPNPKNKVLKAVKPELDVNNIFYEYASKICTADYLLEVYRGVIAKHRDDSDAMSKINENYIQALKFLDEMQIYNDFFRK